MWLSAMMNVPEAIAMQAAVASPARPMPRNAATMPPRRCETATNANRRQHAEERAPAELRRRPDREVTLEEARGRPGDGAERDEDLALAGLIGRVDACRGGLRSATGDLPGYGFVGSASARGTARRTNQSDASGGTAASSA